MAQVNLQQRKIGHWSVLKETDQRSASGCVMWLCRCECGVERLVQSQALISGASSSCGRCSKRKKVNSIVTVDDESAEVMCSDGQSFLIDESDVLLVEKYTWWIDKHGYPKTKFRGRSILLSRMLLDVVNREKDMFIDHVSGDTTDNRRVNLRLCRHEDNVKNRKLNINNKTGFKGVSYSQRLGKYRADIRSGGQKTIYLGCYPTAQEAATAYDQAAFLLHGEFARTNAQIFEEDLNGNC